MKKLFVLLLPFIASAQIDNVKLQQEFSKKLNEYRIAHGLNALTINENANAAAKIQSDYLISTYRRDSTGLITGLLGHDHPDSILSGPGLRLKYIDSTLDLNTASIGENVLVLMAYRYDSIEQLAEKLFQVWKKSCGHNLNMLSKRTEFGIYVSHTSFQASYVDLEFNVSTMKPKPVTKYITLNYYTSSLVLIGDVKWY